MRLKPLSVLIAVIANMITALIALRRDEIEGWIICEASVIIGVGAIWALNSVQWKMVAERLKMYRAMELKMEEEEANLNDDIKAAMGK